MVERRRMPEVQEIITPESEVDNAPPPEFDIPGRSEESDRLDKTIRGILEQIRRRKDKQN